MKDGDEVGGVEESRGQGDHGHVERMERDRIAKSLLGVCAGNRSVGRPRKRWIDTVKEGLRKRGLDVRLARRVVQDRSEWWGFVRGSTWGVVRRMNP